MAQELHIGSILMSDWPNLFGLEGKPYSGRWSVVSALDGFAIDRKIRASGWNFFFVASEMNVTFFGALSAKKIERALHRILDQVSQQHFNGLEVTGIIAKRFLGMPYATVSAHSRHVQQNCTLDAPAVRQSAQQNAEIARG